MQTKIELNYGVTVDGVRYTSLTIQPLTVPMLIMAHAGAEEGQYLSVVELAAQTIICGLDRPATAAELAQLHPDDFKLLTQEAAALEKKALGELLSLPVYQPQQPAQLAQTAAAHSDN